MKLIKQAELLFQGGTSDKVYEVDLCEVGPDQYVVNFRYGRRGSTLKEGTKTALPVAFGKAEQVFDKLVTSKVKKGYLDTRTPVAVTAPAESEPTMAEAPVQSDDPREQAVLERLRAGDVAPPEQPTARGRASRRRQQPQPVKFWPLSRAIWRAGDLELCAAEPLLHRLISPTDHLRNYCIIASLARCGTMQSVPHLRHFYETSGFPDHVRRLAAAALLMVLPDEAREVFREQLLDRLPSAVSNVARRGSSAELESALEAYLTKAKAADYAVLPNLYLIDSAHVRPVILAWLRQASLRPPEVKPLRHLFKLAELRRDAEIFGFIAYRFETTSAMFRHDLWGEGACIPGPRFQYLEADELRRELGSANSRLAFSEKTRQYMRRRVWRTLRRLGELGSPDYVTMAADVLLMYSDDDAREPRELEVFRKSQRRSRYGWDERDAHRVHCDAYSVYWAFNQILYRHSSRYVQTTHSWYCHDNYKPGDPEPDGREEAFPDLWQQAPAHLLRLLRQSHCRPVHAFAVKALRGCTEFCADLDGAILIEFLGSPYVCTAQFGFELAEPRFDPEQPDMELIYAGLVCRYPLGRERVLTWLQALHERDAALLLHRLLTYMLSLDEDHADYAEGLCATLMAGAHTLLEHLDFAMIRQLLGHPLLVLQQLGGEILLRHREPAPFDLIEGLLNAEHETLREFGIRLLGQLPDTELAQRLELVAVLASHADPMVRDAATPWLRRLNASHGAALTELLILRLGHPQLSDGAPSHVLQLLQTEFSSYLEHVSEELVWGLLRAPRSQAHELGGILLQQNVDPETIPVKQIVTLADHDVLAVRQTARALCHQNLSRLKQDMAETVKLLDAKWDDSRAFAFEFFTEQMGPNELRPDILVSICDSIKEDVQQFGRRCITQYFQEADGQGYMMKLSEHPSADMQLFVTHYLERYAADSPARLQQLTPYFISALSLVNKGRATKQRLYEFLYREALKSEAAAQIITGIFTRQSTTIAVGDRANAIRILLQLQKAYPNLDTPLQRRAAVLR